MATDAPAWDACRHGILPIAESIQGIVDLPVADLPERLKSTATRPSFAMVGPWTDGLRLAGIGVVQRRQLVRQWLHEHRSPETATEFDNRLTALLAALREWEEQAYQAAEWNGLDIRNRQDAARQAGRTPAEPCLLEVFGEALCERFQELQDDAERMATWLRLLAAMIRRPPSETNGRAPATADGPHGTDPTVLRIKTVNVSKMTITLETDSGLDTRNLGDNQAARWVAVLLKNRGQFVSAADLEDHDSELAGARPDRLKKRLPDWVAKFIETDVRRGSRIPAV